MKVPEEQLHGFDSAYDRFLDSQKTWHPREAFKEGWLAREAWKPAQLVNPLPTFGMVDPKAEGSTMCAICGRLPENCNCNRKAPPQVEYINLMFEKQDGDKPFDMHFIEAEDADGKGIKAGEWVPRGGNRWALVIPWVRNAVRKEA